MQNGKGKKNICKTAETSNLYFFVKTSYLIKKWNKLYHTHRIRLKSTLLINEKYLPKPDIHIKFYIFIF